MALKLSLINKIEKIPTKQVFPIMWNLMDAHVAPCDQLEDCPSDCSANHNVVRRSTTRQAQKTTQATIAALLRDLARMYNGTLEILFLSETVHFNKAPMRKFW